MSRYSLSNTSTSSNDMLSAPKPQRVPSPNLLADDPITRLQHHHDGLDEYPSDEIDTPAFHTNSSTRDHSRTSSMASTSSTCMHYVISDEFDEDPTLSSSSSISVTHTPSISSVKRPSNSINRSRPPSRSSWISVHLNTAMQTAVKRNSTRHEQVPIPTHPKRSSVDASASAEIRSIIFARCDDDEEDSFATAASGIACSPPMRTHNPLIRDTLFQTKPTPTFTGATSIGSPSLTSIGSPRLPYSLAQALSKSNKGHMDKSDNHDIISPTNGASTNGGRTIFQFSPSSSSQPGIAAN